MQLLTLISLRYQHWQGFYQSNLLFFIRIAHQSRIIRRKLNFVKVQLITLNIYKVDLIETYDNFLNL